MSKKILQTYTRGEIMNVPKPLPTETYYPISHKECIEQVLDNVDRLHLNMTGERYMFTKDYKQVIMLYDFDADDSEMRMQFALRNSIDGTRSFTVSEGSMIVCCLNGMFRSDGDVFKHKHTKGIGFGDDYWMQAISDSFNNMENAFEANRRMNETMKHIHPSYDIASEIIGKLFLSDILTSTQMSTFNRSLHNVDSKLFLPIECDAFSMYDFYNHVTWALKEATPSTYLQRHTDVTKLFEEYL